jgi:hypothetical protein
LSLLKCRRKIDLNEKAERLCSIYQQSHSRALAEARDFQIQVKTGRARLSDSSGCCDLNT